MRLSNYGAAALGITRIGQENGRVLRTISMAGFGGFGAPPPGTRGDFTTMAASNWLNEGCLRGTATLADGSRDPSPGSSFCQCMYGTADRISTVNKNSADFRTGSARWACQIAAEYNFPPWSDDSLLLQIIASGGKADPLKSLPVPEKIAAYRSMLQNVGEKELGIPGVASYKLKNAAGILEQAGIVPAGTFAAAGATINASRTPEEHAADMRAKADTDLYLMVGQRAPDPATDPNGALRYAAAVEENNFRAQNPCPVGVRSPQYGIDENGRAKCGGRRFTGVRPGVIPSPFTPAQLKQMEDALNPPKQSAMPTGLLVGGAVAVVAALFLLKK
jgi:hypothetical protein